MRSPSRRCSPLPRVPWARSPPRRAQPATQQLQLVVVVVVPSRQPPWPRSSGRSHWCVGPAHHPGTRTTIHAALSLPHAAQPPRRVQGCASDLAHPPEVPQSPAPWAPHAAVGRPQTPSQLPCAGCETVLCLVPQRSGRHHGPPRPWGHEEGSPPTSPVCSTKGGKILETWARSGGARLGESVIRHVAQLIQAPQATSPQTVLSSEGRPRIRLSRGPTARSVPLSHSKTAWRCEAGDM